MELEEDHGSMPMQSWTSRGNRGNPHNADYYSELKTWLQRAILQAERNGNNNKKDKLLTLLKDL